MKKIKVLFLIHDLMHGGAEKVLLNLVNNMDHEKFDGTCDHVGIVERCDGTTVYTIEGNSGDAVNSAASIQTILKQKL